MKVILIFSAFLSFSSFGQGLNDEVLIQKIQDQSAGYKTGQLKKWQYKGKIFFELKGPNCCDIPDVLFDENGEKFCILGGGYANKIDIQCSDFFQKGARKFLGTLSFKAKTENHSKDASTGNN